jgi:hypothetical protein
LALVLGTLWNRDRFDIAICDVPYANLVRMDRILPNDTPGRHRVPESVAAGDDPGTS